MSVHSVTGRLVGVNLATKEKAVLEMEKYEFPHIYERDLFENMDEGEPIKSASLVVERRDEIFDIITALETDLNLVC